MKRAFKMKKAFFIIFKGFWIKQIRQIFLEGEGMTLSELICGSWEIRIEKSQLMNLFKV